MEWLHQFLNAQIAWFVLGIVLLVLEFIAPALICIFFALGAFIVMALLFFTPLSINGQLGIFLAAALVSMIVIRKKCVVLFRGHATEENPKGDLCDDFIGFKVVVESEISRNQSGKVLFRGASWQAESEDSLTKGQTAEITGKKGLILNVKKV